MGIVAWRHELIHVNVLYLEPVFIISIVNFPIFAVFFCECNLQVSIHAKGLSSWISACLSASFPLDLIVPTISKRPRLESKNIIDIVLFSNCSSVPQSSSSFVNLLFSRGLRFLVDRLV